MEKLVDGFFFVLIREKGLVECLLVCIFKGADIFL